MSQRVRRTRLLGMVGALTSAIARFLKLMVLIAWDAIRHPLTESTIDYERGTVHAEPAQHG